MSVQLAAQEAPSLSPSCRLAVAALRVFSAVWNGWEVARAQRRVHMDAREPSALSTAAGKYDWVAEDWPSPGAHQTFHPLCWTSEQVCRTAVLLSVYLRLCYASRCQPPELRSNDLVFRLVCASLGPPGSRDLLILPPQHRCIAYAEAEAASGPAAWSEGQGEDVKTAGSTAHATRVFCGPWQLLATTLEFTDARFATKAGVTSTLPFALLLALPTSPRTLHTG